MNSRLVPLLAALVVCAVPPASADEVKAPPVTVTDSFTGKGLTVRLVAEVTAIEPGKPFYAGLWIRHEKGYHTYWSQPGLAGVATKLEWTLPEGFTVSPQLFPPPQKVKMAALNVHGFEQDTLVAVSITPPAELKAASVNLRALASWMCCLRTCNPGFSHLALTLPVGPAARNAEWSPRFQELRDSQPRPAEGWTFTAERDENGVMLTGKPATPETPSTPPSPQFFSSDNLICSDPDQAWEADGAGGFRVRLSPSDFQPDDTTRLRGLLFGATGWNPGGRERYVAIDVPISGKPSARTP